MSVALHVWVSIHYMIVFFVAQVWNDVGVGGMVVLLRITMTKVFFGGKNLANTEYTHKKHFSLTLTINRGKNSKDPKIEPKKWLTFFLSKFSSVMYNWNQNIVPILKINVTLPLLTFSCYFMKSMCIKMKKFGIFYQNISWKLSVCLSYNVIISKQREGLSFIKSF